MRMLKLTVLILLFPTFINSQSNQLPYPIIFVHGINSSSEAWRSEGNFDDIIDYLQYWGCQDGGRIDICLKYSNNITLINNKEDDVHLFTPTIPDGDFYLVNFNVQSDGNLGYEHNYGVITELLVNPTQIEIQVNDFNKFAINDIVRVHDEFMRISGIGPGVVIVERGLFNSIPEYHAFDEVMWNISLESNQASIFKQGWGLAEAISKIKLATGKEKVIIVGHSMGGLAGREYLRSFSQNDVAKIITLGTPHLGSTITEMSELLNIFIGVDERSDAMRDLRYTYGLETDDPDPPFGDIPDDAIYIFGGYEANINFPHNTYYSSDFNADGDQFDLIEGLHSASSFPNNVDYTWIVSEVENIPLLVGDGCVRTFRQFPWWYYDSNSNPILGIGDTLMTHKIHNDETTDVLSFNSRIR